MSVLACGRNSCDNIMCEKLILSGSYYICDDCWKELLELKSTWTKKDIGNIKSLILEFLESTKQQKYQSIDEEFDALTKY